MRNPTWEDFADAVGTEFVVATTIGGIPMTLVKAVQMDQGNRSGTSFRLEFSGPRDPVLPQDIYLFEAGDDALQIFIVPLGEEDGWLKYEAIFN